MQTNLIEKCNGLSSSTKFDEIITGLDKLEFHEHPETHELVLIHSWPIDNGDGDIGTDFEVKDVLKPIYCQIFKKIVELKNKINEL